ncbi:MAG: 50S ribosomal protein L10, partial [Candidatus Heimdallarchaeota archaeon]|nr:50S ribosomal protein L10 [Candidatus Heimdallarchaeota archaeon]
YENIGIIRIENIPNPPLQRIRHSLRGKAKIKVAKNSLMRLALEKAPSNNDEMIQLQEYIKGSCAFIFIKDNPFKVANFLIKNRVPTSAKEGQIAPNEIFIPPQDTGFSPGAIIRVLQSIGLKTQIKGGSVKIVEGAIVCKAGEKVSRKVVNVLNRLGVEPFRVGLSINVLYTEGSVIKLSPSKIDFEKQLKLLAKANQNALALALETSYPIKENITSLIAKAVRQVSALAEMEGLFSKDLYSPKQKASKVLTEMKRADTLTKQIEIFIRTITSSHNPWMIMEFASFFVKDKERREKIISAFKDYLVNNELESTIRWRAAWMLGELEAKSCIQELAKVMNESDNDWELQQAVIWAIGRIKTEDEKIIQTVGNILNDNKVDPRVRSTAASTLGEIADFLIEGVY